LTLKLKINIFNNSFAEIFPLVSFLYSVYFPLLFPDPTAFSIF
jgi:hypothetical protein